jgi:hypothetical protein
MRIHAEKSSDRDNLQAKASALQPADTAKVTGIGHPALQLQQQWGNRFVQRILSVGPARENRLQARASAAEVQRSAHVERLLPSLSNSYTHAAPAVIQRNGYKIHEGKQGKHVKGHKNFMPGKSELTHPDPQSLIDNYAGKGTAVGATAVGKAGSKERVDFGQVIGIYVDPVTNGRLPTTIGIIHYAANDVHIVPARP